MGWVESAVVFYMRTMINRLVPYQPNPLPFVVGFGFAEVIHDDHAAHRSCLTALGDSRAEYFGEVRRELRRFIVSLARTIGAAKKFPCPVEVDYSPVRLA